MNTVPALDMAGWQIVSFEVRYEYLVQMEKAAHSILNQPRASVDHSSIPGVNLVEDDIQDIFHCQNDLLDALRQRRFDDAEDDQRRKKLLILHELTYPGADLLELIRIAVPIGEPLGSLAEA